jgi:hypothetical protein
VPSTTRVHGQTEMREREMWCAAKEGCMRDSLVQTLRGTWLYSIRPAIGLRLLLLFLVACLTPNSYNSSLPIAIAHPILLRTCCWCCWSTTGQDCLLFIMATAASTEYKRFRSWVALRRVCWPSNHSGNNHPPQWRSDTNATLTPDCVRRPSTL